MRRRRVGRWIAAAAVAGMVASGCAAARRPATEHDEETLSAEHLDDLTEEGSLIADLEPEQRKAAERAGMAVSGDGPARPGARNGEGAADTAGKVSLSVLEVALSLAAVAAPFFLF